MPDDVISCLSSDDDETVPGETAVDTADSGADSQKENVENGSRDGAAAAASTKPPPPLLGEAAEGDDEDVEVVDASAAPRWNAVAATSTATAAAAGGGKAMSNDDNDDDDEEEEELEIVGTANEQKFPHSRQDCLEFRYQAATNATTNDNNAGNDNAKFCTLCYCYVCDKPASECGEWYRGGRGTCPPVAAAGGESDNATATAKSTGEEEDEEKDGKPKADDASSSNSTERNKPYKNHCDATDKGPHSQLWQNMRKAVREGRDPSQVTHAPEPAGSLMDGMQQWLANYGPPNPASYSYGSGSAGFGRNDRHAHRLPATARGGARQARSHTDYDSTHGGTSAASAAGMYASASYEAARAATARGRSRSAPARRRVRSGGGNSRGSSSGSKRPAPHDHRQRIRTQAMLEDLYG